MSIIIINNFFRLFLLCVLSVTAFAQDTIVFKNSFIEIVSIQNMTQSQIHYKKYLNPSGTLYIINKYEVSKVKFQNGLIEIYDSIKYDNQNISQTKITEINYAMVKKNYNELIAFVDNRGSIKNKEQLYKKADFVARLSRHQIATRIGSVTFACFTAASLVVLGFDNIITLGNPEDGFFVPPATFGFFTLAFAASNFGINQNLRKNRKSFVALYNDL